MQIWYRVTNATAAAYSVWIGLAEWTWASHVRALRVFMSQASMWLSCALLYMTTHGKTHYSYIFQAFFTQIVIHSNACNVNGSLHINSLSRRCIILYMNNFFLLSYLDSVPLYFYLHTLFKIDGKIVVGILYLRIFLQIQ